MQIELIVEDGFCLTPFSLENRPSTYRGLKIQRKFAKIPESATVDRFNSIL